MFIAPLFLFLAQTPSLPANDKVVAKVDGQEIHASEVVPFVWDWYGQAAMQEIILNRLIAEEATRRKVEATDAEIQAQIQKQTAQFMQRVQGAKDPEAALREQGMTKSRLGMRAKSIVLIEKMAAQDFHPEDLVKASTMMVRAASQSPADDKAAKDKATALYTKLKTGTKWDDVVKSLASPGQPPSAGQLDWTPISAFPAGIQTEMKGLAVGRFTQPVQTPGGYQIFRVDQKGQELKGADLDAVKTRMLPNLQGLLVQKLRDSAKIEYLP